MLYRIVRPMKRSGSSFDQFQQRIPAEVRRLLPAHGLNLLIPLGDSEHHRVTVFPRMKAIRLSLRTRDPNETKIRNAVVAAHLEETWRALRENRPVTLDHYEATALAGELYRAWTERAAVKREHTDAVVQVLNPAPGAPRMVPAKPEEDDDDIGPETAEANYFEATLAYLERLGSSGIASDLEKPLGRLVDRLLLRKGIAQVDEPSRRRLLWAFWQALKDALAVRERNARGDYSPDPKALRFPPELEKAAAPPPSSSSATAPVSLTALLDGWHAEAGRKPSTYESYRSTIIKFIAFLGHDDAARVTKQDVIRFKDYRLASNNPRTQRKLSPRTVKNNDLAALNVIFGWAVINAKLDTNPAVGVVIKLGTRQQVRPKDFYEAEAGAILRAALNYTRGSGHESQRTAAAKHWVPFLCAYTGARVGEMAQLRKQDVRRAGGYWIITITPEAGTVKTNKYRDVVIHEHLIELGFADFVNQAPDGHLFLNVLPGDDVRGLLQSLKNRLQEFVRTIVTDPNVKPNHGWRDTFKTLGIVAGIEGRVLDAIQGHAPRSVGDTYGHVTHEALAEAMRKFPRFKIPD